MNSVILIYSFWYNNWSESANCLASIHSVLHSLLYLGSINMSCFKNICSISVFLCRMNGQGVEMEDLAQSFWENSWKGSSHLASTLCPLSVLRLRCDVFSTHSLLWRWKPHAKDGRGESPTGLDIDAAVVLSCQPLTTCLQPFSYLRDKQNCLA